MDNVTPEQLEKHISALRDSVFVINTDISSGNVDEQTIDNVRRNYQHIEIMLNKNFIISNVENLTEFEAAIVAGKSFVANNE